MMRGLALLPARAFYALDAAAGMLRGGACPSCGTRRDRNEIVRRRSAGLIPVRRCHGCGLLYRPVGFRDGLALEVYYSFLYTRAGLATARGLARSPEELRRKLSQEGKDRSGLVLAVQPPPAKVCVFGCSWGYELLPLRAQGYDVIGVELSRTRREHGRATLGLALYPTVRDAATEHPSVDVVLSSHVLEHIPALEGALGSIQESLRPRVQVHITPAVEELAHDPGCAAAVGREHPIGVTRRFWERVAMRSGRALEFEVRGGEAVAVLR